MEKLFKKPYVVFDVETTGLSPHQGDEVIEIGAIKIFDHKIIDEFHDFIVPLRGMSEEVIRVHGLTLDFLNEQGSPDHQVMPKFLHFIRKFPLVGHNIRQFDVPFVNSHLTRLELPLISNEIYDTLELARLLINLDSYKLGNIAKHYSIDYSQAHRAKDDALITHQVLLKLLKKI